MMVCTLSAFDGEKPLFGKFGPSNQNWLFKLKFGM